MDFYDVHDSTIRMQQRKHDRNEWSKMRQTNERHIHRKATHRLTCESTHTTTTTTATAANRKTERKIKNAFGFHVDRFILLTFRITHAH